jgi:hypothetical protein
MFSFSPILLNSGLEHAMQNWKQFLKPHVYTLVLPANIQTDVMHTIFCSSRRSSRECVEMLELLVVELNRAGWHLNTSKKKLFRTSCLEHPLYIAGCGDLCWPCCEARRNASISADHLQTFDTSLPSETATRSPNWLVPCSQTHIV